MSFIPKLLAAVSAALLFMGFETGEVERQPATRLTTPVVAGVSSFSPATTFEVATPTTASAGVRVVVPSTAFCGRWWGLAIELGWGYEDMETLDYIMWRESRCDPSQHNTTLNADGSTDVGLTQINDRSWCLPTKWYPGGYLQTLGVLATVGCEQLFDPATNLRAARAIYEYHVGQGQYGFEAWGL